MSNVSEREQARAALREEQARLDALPRAERRRMRGGPRSVWLLYIVVGYVVFAGLKWFVTAALMVTR